MIVFCLYCFSMHTILHLHIFPFWGHGRTMSPAQADLMFLENAKKLSMYGVDLHQAKVSWRGLVRLRSPNIHVHVVAMLATWWTRACHISWSGDLPVSYSALQKASLLITYLSIKSCTQKLSCLLCILFLHHPPTLAMQFAERSGLNSMVALQMKKKT